MELGIWIFAGLVVGFVASKLILRARDGLARDLGLGVAGAVVAGLIFGVVNTAETADFDVFGLVVTLAGACATLIVYHTLFPAVRAG